MMNFEMPKYVEGDAEKQKKAEERQKAILEGRLPEFDAMQQEQPAETKPVKPLEERKAQIREGKPWAKFIGEASQIRLRTGDKRTIDEIAQELMEKAEPKQEEQAA